MKKFNQAALAVAAAVAPSIPKTGRKGPKPNPSTFRWSDHGWAARPWRDRNSPFYGMTGKAYRRLEKKMRRQERERGRVAQGEAGS